MGRNFATKVYTLQRKKRHIALEEFNFFWDAHEIKNFKSMWNEGKSIKQIAIILDRDPDEVLILAIDQARSGYIKKRQGGAMGVMA
ncbi:hypothetical protein J2Z32_004486 [Paenibacillus turicensis]|uniref:Helix-turn-helix domain containing protein n=1 Tax=Paenibacillus turicensis TaxID=160487 RepID=A0ABS4FZ21_9BACL|nr:helix-turn-helix domain containing protein [Paenibacillus turicensis]MBP1907797.1 hypothetical protein [Paenibacillus turicensis]